MNESGAGKFENAILLAKVTVFTIVVPLSVTVWIPFFYYPRLRPPVADVLPAGMGLLLMVTGAAGYLWCAWEFAVRGRGTPAPIDAPRNFVAGGAYRFVRNPMYASVLLVLWGESMTFGWLALARYALVVWAFFHLFVVYFEEPGLRRRFGESYEAYCRDVRRWLPKFPGGSKANAI